MVKMVFRGEGKRLWLHFGVMEMYCHLAGPL